jgi:uncharacterized protein YndB with AHSA1/START domain
MWNSTYSKTVADVTAQQLWSAWSDVNQWHKWQPDIEYARLDDPFETGNSFAFKPKGGPHLKIELSSVTPGASFTDITRFPLARMVDSHELIDHGGEVEIRTTLRMEGPLSFLWRKLVGEDVAKSLPQQTDALVRFARDGH